jgi:hypothetical protein
MRKDRFVFRTFALLTLFCAGAVFAQAQSDRTFVSRAGSDANPCSKTAPCATFAGAFAKTNTGGEINAVEPGDYSNGSTFVINRAVTIDGLGVGATLTAQAFQDAIRIEVGAADTVIIRNLSLTGFQESLTANPGDNGIRYVSGGALVIQNCDIHSFEGAGLIAQVRANPTAAGTFPAKLAMSDVKIYNNYSYGIYLDGRDGQPLDFAIDNARIEANGVNFGNGVGLAVFAFNGGVRGVIRDSVLAGNTAGINVESSAGRNARVHIEDCSITINQVGVQTGFLPGGGSVEVFISDTVVQFNQSAGLTATGNQIRSFGDNKIGPGQGVPGQQIPKQ